jgi:hypothetical protein
MYHERVVEEFEWLSAKHQVVVLDGDRKVDTISGSIRDIDRKLMRQ